MCPLCDGLGVTANPGRPGAYKKCPECDAPPSPLVTLTLAGWCFGPAGPTEDDDWSEIQAARVRARRAEEADYLRRHLAGLIPGDLPAS